MTTIIQVTDEERNLVEEKVKSLLKAVALDVNLETEVEGARLYFNVSGPDTRYFLRNKEEVLRNISLLLHSFHQKAFPKSEIEIKFDANHSLKEREKEVRAMAFSAGEQLVEEGDEILLNPLNPYERRIVHIALKGREEFRTESVGEGHYKKVRIRYIGVEADEDSGLV